MDSKITVSYQLWFCISFFILASGLLGFVLFLMSAKRYNYRKRDDINFYHRDIEEVYTYYLLQAPSATANNSD